MYIGDLVSSFRIAGLPCQGHTVHLLTYIEGEVLDSLHFSPPDYLLEEIGQTIARYRTEQAVIFTLGLPFSSLI